MQNARFYHRFYERMYCTVGWHRDDSQYSTLSNGEGIIPIPYNKRTELHFTVTKLTYTDYIDILFDVNELNFVESDQ